MSNSNEVEIELNSELENERSKLDLEELIMIYMGDKVVGSTKERFKYLNGEEKNMARLRQEFFARRADEVAQDLLGRYIFVRQKNDELIQARLREIGAYEGATNSSPEGIYYNPGIVFVSTKFGQRLLHISTGKDKKASCLTLRSADFNDERIVGPGNLTKLLGINRDNQNLYDNQNAYGRTIWVGGEVVSKEIIKRRDGNSENCLGYYYF